MFSMSERMKQIIDRLFVRLQGLYGSTFTNKFSTGVGRDGIDHGLENAKQVWSEELGGFADNLDAIGYALKNTDPKFPPTAREFLALCRQAPRKEPLKLGYTPSAEEVEKSRAMAERLARKVKTRGPDWETDVWAMQPRTVAHFKLILNAIDSQPDRFGKVLEKLVEQGVVSEDGRLLKCYLGAGQWGVVR